MDQRLEQLKTWLHNDVGLGEFSIAPASEDASFRRYFRVTLADESLIVMDAPPDKEDCRPFVAIAEAMGHFGVNVPRILELDLEQGFLLLNDLGTTQYLSVLNDERVDKLYDDAIKALVHLQAHGPVDQNALPPYDHDRLLAEMELFREWYLGRHLGVELSDEQHQVLDETFEWLISSALEQPKVWVHRDYHSRNLMLTETNNPGVLDFQDAVIGPLTYDLVSLLKDCYITWPRSQVIGWVQHYQQLAEAAGIVKDIEFKQLLEWFDLMGLQRHIKVMGIFSRLNYRDGKAGYLDDIPRVAAYVREVVPMHPKLNRFDELLEALVYPRLDEKS